MNEDAPNQIAVGVAIRTTAMIAAAQPMVVVEVDFNYRRIIDQLRQNTSLMAHFPMGIAKKATTPPGNAARAARLTINSAIFNDVFFTIV